jgi:hypothetical protein
MAGFLAEIHGQIGSLQQQIGTVSVIGVKHGPDAYMQKNLFPFLFSALSKS